MAKYVMALDQGTTSSRCILFDKNGLVVSAASKELKQIFPKPGWVEHDPNEILAGQICAAKEAMAKANATAKDISAIGITNQRETAIVWDRHTGKPVYNAIVWQCRRTSGCCDRLKSSGFSKIIKEKTGLVTDAYFSATKIKWILENIGGAMEKAKNGDLLFGTVDTWLLWNLTGGSVHATDYSNASRTMMYNIHTLEWDKDILRELGILSQMLPEVKPSGCVFGESEETLFEGRIPITGIAGDQQAALFGQFCHEEGMVKNTYGTGCFILMNTGNKAIGSSNGLLTTIAWGLSGKIVYALEGSVFTAGALIKWLRDELCLISSTDNISDMAINIKNTNGCYIVPAFAGLGAPYWNQNARGAITGLTGGVNKLHIARAALESIAYQSYDVIKAMEADCNFRLKQVRVDGGASANDFLMQFQADILNLNVVRPLVIESTALGVACLAGLTAGFFECLADVHEKTIFEPKMDITQRGKFLSGWEKAVKQVNI